MTSQPGCLQYISSLNNSCKKDGTLVLDVMEKLFLKMESSTRNGNWEEPLQENRKWNISFQLTDAPILLIFKFSVTLRQKQKSLLARGTLLVSKKEMASLKVLSIMELELCAHFLHARPLKRISKFVAFFDGIIFWGTSRGWFEKSFERCYRTFRLVNIYIESCLWDTVWLQKNLVSHILGGRTNKSCRSFFRKSSVVEQLLGADNCKLFDIFSKKIRMKNQL